MPPPLPPGPPPSSVRRMETPMALPDAPGARGAVPGRRSPGGCAGHAGRGRRGDRRITAFLSRRNTRPPGDGRITIRIARRTVSQNRERRDANHAGGARRVRDGASRRVSCGILRRALSTAFVVLLPPFIVFPPIIVRILPLLRLLLLRRRGAFPPARRTRIDAPPSVRSRRRRLKITPRVASRGFPESRIAARGSHASHARVSRGSTSSGSSSLSHPPNPPPLDTEPVDPPPSTRFGGGGRAKRLVPDEDDDGGAADPDPKPAYLPPRLGGRSSRLDAFSACLRAKKSSLPAALRSSSARV